MVSLFDGTRDSCRIRIYCHFNCYASNRSHLRIWTGCRTGWMVNCTVDAGVLYCRWLCLRGFSRWNWLKQTSLPLSCAKQLMLVTSIPFCSSVGFWRNYTFWNYTVCREMTNLKIKMNILFIWRHTVLNSTSVLNIFLVWRDQIVQNTVWSCHVQFPIIWHIGRKYRATSFTNGRYDKQQRNIVKIDFPVSRDHLFLPVKTSWTFWNSYDWRAKSLETSYLRMSAPVSWSASSR